MFNLSIITINYNDAKGLLATITSIANQTLKEFEFIVIDGGSKDESVDVIKANNQLITYWCSEKDKGIYDAQNKGIAKSTGKYLLFLNSGDTFYSNTVIEKFNNYLVKNNQYGIIYGNTNLIDKTNKQSIKYQPKQLSLNFWYKETLNHQSTFIRRDLFSSLGNYDISYRICADFDFFLKAYLNNPDMFGYLNETIANYTLDGFSSNPENFSAFITEHDGILKKQLTQKQYDQVKKAYFKTQPRKEQVLHFIRSHRSLKAIFDIIYKTYKVFNR